MENKAKDKDQSKAGQDKKEEKLDEQIKVPLNDKLNDNEVKNNDTEKVKDKKGNVSGFDEWSVSWP